MGPKRPRPLVLDAGALIAVDRGDRRVIRLLELAEEVQLCAATGTSDVVDASVVLVARLLDAVTVTSDPDDLRRLDPRANLVSC